ncbi:hypothetical protein DICVIV_13550 [Dictyocaulus viviparus]|uniref:WD domain, G-beta repeat protein n=1 Tax=Dictyocaulus viviparus TaxID=29172 RepID=A0A0D8X7I1_DICVI|nr:hypothetical protein DICVIV_13550 [Dictyocaulus viviparus]
MSTLNIEENPDSYFDEENTFCTFTETFMKVNAIAISPDNTICVTVGSKHVKYWHIPKQDSQVSSLQSRSAILADRRSSVFVDVVFLNNSIVLAITEDGALVEFLNKKLGCTNGIIRLYDKDNLNIHGQLPHPAFIGMDPACVTSAEVFKFRSHSVWWV